MSWPKPIRIVGIGSPNGDDRAGWEAAWRLRECSLQATIHTVDGGQGLLDVLDGKGTLLLIDALEPTGHPGYRIRCTWPDNNLRFLSPGSTHDFSPLVALRLAESLGLLPQRVEVFGIEGEKWGPGDALTPAVAHSVAELVVQVGGILDDAELAG